MHRVLFVDDEPKILTGLRRMLRALRQEWEMEFAESGPAAMDVLASADFDVIVSDARMPGMEGSELLSEVQKNYPDTVRIILSGQCGRSSVLKCIGVAHQFLSKPCDSVLLIRAIRQVCHLRDCVPAVASRVAVSQMASLPSRADMYHSLANQLSSSATSEKAVAATIGHDVAMSLKVMQLVSSGFFGSPQRGVDVVRAVELLGIDTLRELMRLPNAFRLPLPDEISDAELRNLSEQSVVVARAAKRIAEVATRDRLAICDSYLAGLLHQIGRLALAIGVTDAPLSQGTVGNGGFGGASSDARTLRDADDSGGYLAALWGLPEAIVRAIRGHREPGKWRESGFQPLTALHVACALVRRDDENDADFSRSLDTDYLLGMDCTDLINDWREICHQSEFEETLP